MGLRQSTSYSQGPCGPLDLGTTTPQKRNLTSSMRCSRKGPAPLVSYHTRCPRPTGAPTTLQLKDATSARRSDGEGPHRPRRLLSAAPSTAVSLPSLVVLNVTPLPHARTVPSPTGERAAGRPRVDSRDQARRLPHHCSAGRQGRGAGRGFCCLAKPSRAWNWCRLIAPLASTVMARSSESPPRPNASGSQTCLTPTSRYTAPL
jgi:hypothetical protein